MKRRICLRCGKRPAVGRWQCASCRQDFRDWQERDYSAALEDLGDYERTLITISERLNGAGFWVAGEAVMRSAERVSELAWEIEEDLRR